MSRPLSPPTRILKVCIEALTGFSYIYYPDVLNNRLLSQGCALETGSHCANSGHPFQGQGKGEESDCAGPANRLTGSHTLSMTPSNISFMVQLDIPGFPCPIVESAIFLKELVLLLSAAWNSETKTWMFSVLAII